jgi:hypothetical protein
VVVDAEKKKAKENEREKLFQVKRKKCAQKEFDRADIVRDVRYNVLPMSQAAHSPVSQVGQIDKAGTRIPAFFLRR